MKIIIDNGIPFIKGVFEPFVDVEYYEGGEICNDHLRNAEVLIIRTRTKCNRKLLEGSKVRFIASATIGYDHIDIDYCREAGVKWVNAPGCNAGAVNQWVMAALLSYADKNNIDLTKRTLGVVGVGNVGEKVVKTAEALGMRVLLNDPPKSRLEGRCGYVTIETILQECDIISFHVPLNYSGQDKTFHMVNDALLNKVIKGTVIINSSRGEVIDTNALLKALNTEQVKDAFIDVWENEPDINRELLKRSAIATPHIAGYSFEGKAQGTAMVVKAVSEYFNLPLNSWEPEELEWGKERYRIIANGLSFQEICYNVVLNSYSIDDDTLKLLKYPGKFEELRGSYLMRHEPGYYELEIISDLPSIYSRLSSLGFILKE